MTNTQKSWKGKPITNQFTLPSSAVNGFGVQNSTFTRIYSGRYGGYDIQPTDYVWQYNINGSDCPYHGWDISTTAGDTVTFSFDYFVSSTTIGYPSTNFLANFENAGSGTSGSYIDPTPSTIGVWKQAYFSATATSTGNSRCLLYPGACGGQLASGTGFILYKNPQVEFNAPGGIPTPFVAGTRSNTQAILDLTGNNTLTTSSLTYNSDGKFSFNGTSNFISASTVTLPSGTSNSTMLVWCYPDSSGPTDQYTGLLSYGNRSSSDSRLLSLYTSGTTMYVSSAYWGNDYTPNNLAVTANAWNMVGMTTLGSGVANNTTLYCGNASGFNSVTGSSSSYATPLATQSKNLAIGCTDFGGRYMKGKIAMALIYDRALTSAEMQQNFNALRKIYGI
jgi:hypothetical protein